ncbi:hypothetical protein ACFV9E_06150 [Streptomyces sp. NPDC059835]|uniref:hypothetical protein n=1 Tax=Streptomyces sp. NPDC059835 TaxID=3346967 RepID=UPI003654A223
MGEIWIPEAIRLGDGVIAGAGAMDTPNNPPRAVWHTTEGSSGTAAAFQSTADYLMSENYEPHILYDPKTDMLGQFGPLNQSAKALVNAGSVRTNRTGRVCIQIEVMAKAGTAFTGYWKPGKNFRALLRAIRSWGIPDEWPAGRLAQSYSDDSPRPLNTWLTRGGHYGHSNVPGNDHWDPGAIDRAALLAAGAATTTPTAPIEEDPMAGFTPDDVAHSVLYWLNQSMSPTPEVPGGGHPLANVVPSLAAKFKAYDAVLAALPANSKLTPAEIAAALADGTLKVTVTVAPKAG